MSEWFVPRVLRALPAHVAAAATIIAMTAGLAFPAFADELQDVSKLVAAGRLIEAGNRADAYLEKMPKDAQMRFLKGVILSQRGERDAAVAVFTGLTQDYPELPEPYNNLAVIDAARGEYDDARAALESAIRVAPNNATAYENLGDIYAALAARAYRDARRYDARNASAVRKLDVVRGLLTATPVAAAPAAVDQPVASTDSTASTASTAAAAAAAAANRARSQRNVGLPGPSGFPSLTAGRLAEPPEAIVPAGADAASEGTNVVGIETPAPDRANAVVPTATLVGAATVIAPAAGDAAQPIARITTAVQRWASTRSLTPGELNIRVDGDAATARFHATDARGRKPATTDRTLTLHRNGDAWVVTDEGS